MVSIEHRSPVVISTELVDSCHQNFVMAFCHAFGFHAPWFSFAGVYSYFVMRDSPVGANHSVIVLLFAQHILNKLPAESTTYTVRFESYASGVVGHQGSRYLGFAFQLESTLRERQRMQFEIAVGENGVFSISLMPVASAFVACSGARPVFHHRVYTVPTPSVTYFRIAFRCLETVAIGTCHIGSKFGTFSHCIAEAHPSRVGSYVHHREEGSGEPQCPVFDGAYFRKTFHDFR